MRRILILATTVALAVSASPASAKPKARIAGSLTVGATVTAVAKKGTIKKVRWQRCPSVVVADTCSDPQLIGRGRSITLDSATAGLSVRALGKIKGKRVATKWSSPVAGGTPTPTPTPPPATTVVVPAGWEITGGSPSNITSNQAVISNAYAEIARLVGGGRFLSHFEGGSSGIIIQRELTMCSDRSFRFVDAGVTNVTGTWRMTVNFSNPQDIAPRLILTPTTGQPSTLAVDLNQSKAGHVLLNNEDFLSGPSSSCA
jgi:hypothetical protein